MKKSTLFWLVIIFLAASGLYRVKYQVRDIRKETSRLEASIKNEYNSLHVLRAEWAYLNRPDRLQRLSERYLELKPFSAIQMMPEEMVAHLELPTNPDEQNDEQCIMSAAEKTTRDSLEPDNQSTNQDEQ